MLIHNMDIFKNHMPYSSQHLQKQFRSSWNVPLYLPFHIHILSTIYFPSQVSCLRKPNGFLIRKLFRHEMYQYICMYVHKIQLPYINHTITTPLATLFIYFLAQLFSKVVWKKEEGKNIFLHSDILNFHKIMPLQAILEQLIHMHTSLLI